MTTHLRRSPSPKLWAKLKPEARRMRKEPTEAEARLWKALRNRELQGFKFRRQHAIGTYIVDFCCPAASSVVEVDGPIHASQSPQDAMRDEELNQLGYRVLRLTNDEVLQDIHAAVARIVSALRERSAIPNAPLHSMERGRG